MPAPRRLPLALILAALLVPSVGAAQHDDLVLVDPEYSGCALCHASHNRASGAEGGAYALRLDPLPGVWSMRSNRGVVLGAASRSCLRCHLTPEVRLRQPEFRGGGGPVGEGAYLRADLTDDHPVGRLDTDRVPLVDGAFGPPSSSRVQPFGAAGPMGQHTMECTTCHDPHDRWSSIPDADRQRVLCGACHDPAIHASDPRHADLACSDCHGMHGGHDDALLAERDPDQVCTACHGGGPALSKAASRREPALLMGPRGHIEPPAGTCISCHPAHR